uniref:Uncharacterized protein n=1 Tax=Favella ehrenbergii TaxID=182087 RepID=A0A7S3MLF0_9SPIT|mmetsp:Transcript_29309/g.36405  ORF Transcript_29309/g.36405 Transcript_29309/m.36405 type:complete len:139 (+) Transcript_29309:662-1078(+)|eukprot:CAMPEP_0170474592 /NCGR_PEP_ID=MMETSP0123-20130129/16343_1 /TAXON_ID=182087 /ORGANISM="Favella ehrenbergii, Strain Fehren 1" /LENGTH=138 /DNA_ID=CAMNT_0010744457 /DNA_START=2315 /DNA_END=2731 /DNA_ORIENTATION=+
MIMLCAMSLSTLGNEFFSVTLGANFINFYRTDFLGIRSSVVVSQGWFYHRDTIYGLTEGIESLTSPALACLYFAITFYLILFSIIIAGMYTGRMLEGLLIARAKGKTLRELKYKNELNIIELEINAKKKKIDKQRNKL